MTAKPLPSPATLSALEAWATRCGLPKPNWTPAPDAEPYNVADITPAVYDAMVDHLSRRYVAVQMANAGRTNAKSHNPDAPLTNPNAKRPPRNDNPDRDRTRTEQAYTPPLSLSELRDRAPDAAADYLAHALARMATATTRRGETIARNGWQRRGITRGDHARALLIIASQAKRSLYRTGETETGRGRRSTRGHYPYVHGMSATGDNPATIAANAEAYARHGITDTLYRHGRGNRSAVTMPEPDTLYRDAVSQARAALTGEGTREGNPCRTYTGPGGTCRAPRYHMVATYDHTIKTRSFPVSTTVTADAPVCITYASPEGDRNLWASTGFLVTEERQTYAPVRWRMEPTTDTANAPAVDHEPATVLDADPEPAPVVRIAPPPGPSPEVWHMDDGTPVSTTRRGTEPTKTPEPWMAESYRDMMAHQATLPRSPYKDWNPDAVTATRRAVEAARARHDAAARAAGLDD